VRMGSGKVADGDGNGCLMRSKGLKVRLSSSISLLRGASAVDFGFDSRFVSDFPS